MNFLNPSIRLRGKIFTFDQPTIMGIINFTGDSFFEGSRVQVVDEALRKAEAMHQEGATFVDLGATSTRPGAALSEASNEITKLIPVIESIRKTIPELYISVDTYHAEVAHASVDAGADMINDISGGSLDDKMFHTIGQLKVPYVLMHIKGRPDNMQLNPQYEDVPREVYAYFTEKIKQLYEAGANDILVDPGFGFGKTLAHNYQLFNALPLFHQLRMPLLVGVSRKSMVNKVLGTTPEQALNGTTVLHTLALQMGAHILRVHDVKEARQAIDILNFAKNYT
ncbi:MAG: dihydropteroate synthase [Flavobacteriales bacterium]